MVAVPSPQTIARPLVQAAYETDATLIHSCIDFQDKAWLFLSSLVVSFLCLFVHSQVKCLHKFVYTSCSQENDKTKVLFLGQGSSL